MKNSFLIIGLLILALSCREEPDAIPAVIDHGRMLTGTWVLVEVGGSPGAGYYTEPVSTNPPQILVLGSDGSVSTNISELAGYTRFEVHQDPDATGEVVTFLAEDDSASPDSRSYGIGWEEKKLKLFFRWCFEGCHIGLVKIAAPAED